jgi:hypothetical protein
MRLTLRTLLAYLDDILEPAQAKEIGSKISESNFAVELVNRIRDVMRRRRLTSPDLEGPASGLDPNVVAEYLDNVLPPEKVPDVERVCLESDVHLAEAAACHQILTAALGEPVQILHQSREHMYALVPMAKPAASQVKEAVQRPIANGEPNKATTTVGQGERTAAAKPAADTGTEFENTIPDFLRPRPLWKRAMPYTVVGLIAVAWVGLLYMGDLFPETASDGTGDVAADGANLNGALAAKINDGRPLSISGANSDASNFGTEPNGVVTTPAPQNEERIDLPAPLDEAVGGDPVVDAVPPGGLNLPAATVGKPATEPAAKVAVNVPEVKPNPAAVPAPVVAPAPAAPLLQYNSPSGILLRYDSLAEGWMVMSPRAIIHPGERFAAPEPFDAVINIGDALARATLVSGSVARILPPTKAAATGFGIEQGRVILQPVSKSVGDNKEENAEEKPVVLAVAVRDELWRVELLSQNTVCGIEIIPVQPSRPDQEFGIDMYFGRIFVIAGSVRFADGTGKVQLINGPGWRSLTPSDRAAEANAPVPVAGPPLLTLPVWLDPVAKTSVARTVRRSATLYTREFDVKRPLSENVHSLIKDDRPYISALAVKSLALTGNYTAMAEALNAAHEESRMAAIIGLRNWLPLNKGNGELLKQALQKRFAPKEADIVLRLLWGYSEADLTDRTTSERLVMWLDDNSLIVREAAFYHIYRLTATKYDYVALRPQAQRRAAINRWEDRIKEEGALIAPVGE